METEAKASKEILKKEEDHSQDKKAKHIKWDEKGIEEWDQQRGKTMKITEAKTPYNRETFTDEEEEHDAPKQSEELKTNEKAKPTSQLNAEALNAAIQKKDWDKVEEEFEKKHEEDEAARKKHEDFLKWRKNHYDEGRKLKELMKKKALEEDEDEDA